jgi:hypothetical protein
MFSDNPVLKVPRYNLLRVDRIVTGPEDEECGVLTDASVLITSDPELVATHCISALTKNGHPRGIKRTRHLVDGAKDAFVLADPPLPLIAHDSHSPAPSS